MTFSHLPVLTTRPADQRDKEQGRDKTIAKLTTSESAGETKSTNVIYTSSCTSRPI
jgi:hypothetical protein